jgi:hypothetical protein
MVDQILPVISDAMLIGVVGYFLNRLVKNFDVAIKMANENKTDIAVLKATDGSKTLAELNTKVILLEAKTDAAWRELDKGKQ